VAGGETCRAVTTPASASGSVLAEWDRGWMHCHEAEERWGMVSKKKASVRGAHSPKGEAEGLNMRSRQGA